jgi:hypothetical protein
VNFIRRGNKQLYLRLAGTWLASALFTLLIFFTDTHGQSWIAREVWPLGGKLAAIFFPQGTLSEYGSVFIALAMIFNTLPTWIVLLIILKLFERFIIRKREIA